MALLDLDPKAKTTALAVALIASTALGGCTTTPQRGAFDQNVSNLVSERPGCVQSYSELELADKKHEIILDNISFGDGKSAAINLTNISKDKLTDEQLKQLSGDLAEASQNRQAFAKKTGKSVGRDMQYFDGVLKDFSQRVNPIQTLVEHVQGTAISINCKLSTPQQQHIPEPSALSTRGWNAETPKPETADPAAWRKAFNARPKEPATTTPSAEQGTGGNSNSWQNRVSSQQGNQEAKSR